MSKPYLPFYSDASFLKLSILILFTFYVSKFTTVSLWVGLIQTTIKWIISYINSQSWCHYNRNNLVSMCPKFHQNPSSNFGAIKLVAFIFEHSSYFDNYDPPLPTLKLPMLPTSPQNHHNKDSIHFPSSSHLLIVKLLVLRFCLYCLHTAINKCIHFKLENENFCR